MALHSQLVRDPEYYIPDGNTVIQVENVLFKVHRYILSRDGSAFEGMFSLDNIPNSDSAETLIMPHSESIQTYPHSHSHLHHRHSSPEGASDKSPILLTGDTAADFRSLLWALYALPADVFAMPSTQPQLNRLIGIARIAHKYAFRTTESWALSVLTMCVCQAPDTPSGHDIHGDVEADTEAGRSIVSSTELLIQLTEVAVLCAHDELHEAVEPIWADLLFAGQTHDIVSAIGLADRYTAQLRPLLGLAYYLMMLKGKEEWLKSASGDDEGDPEKMKKPRLTRDQRIRLLSGYYNLSRACESLPSNPPKLTHHPSCYMPAQQAQQAIGLGGAGTAAAHAHARCGESWDTLWAGLVMNTASSNAMSNVKIQSVDLLRKMHMVNHVLENMVNGVDGMAGADGSGAANVASTFNMMGYGGAYAMAGNMNKHCLRMALKASEEKVNDVLYGLADCFVE
ncbi:hypothetical protein EV361DRAFT_794742 [Lentinula raphanica]|uniref:BTB domain-containing protein n=1 Tax=Lentinula raphanica TaxID=153919 RepID=A0AA38PGK2_9AGAR|nr:hypothetical protein F5880DRAFT_1482482 [Lentinula raphanica]KAJ3842557.1 hypothetical protein F5878DRAFT_529607 [Lentinula raphanica]KAJ3974208.1 hypothetical protein EV361DRAFT_794742 [Lentinula raphanica]